MGGGRGLTHLNDSLEFFVYIVERAIAIYLCNSPPDVRAGRGIENQKYV